MVVKLLSNYLTKSNYFRVGAAFSPRMIVAKSKLRFDCHNKDVFISRRLLSTKVENNLHHLHSYHKQNPNYYYQFKLFDQYFLVVSRSEFTSFHWNFENSSFTSQPLFRIFRLCVACKDVQNSLEFFIDKQLSWMNRLSRRTVVMAERCVTYEGSIYN